MGQKVLGQNGIGTIHLEAGIRYSFLLGWFAEGFIFIFKTI